MLNKLLKGLVVGFFLVFIFFGATSKAQAVCTTTWSAYSNPALPYSSFWNAWTNSCGPTSSASSAANLKNTVVSQRTCIRQSGTCNGTETCDDSGTLYPVFTNQYMTVDQPFFILSNSGFFGACNTNADCDPTGGIVTLDGSGNSVTAYDSCLSQYDFDISFLLSKLAFSGTPQTYAYGVNSINQSYAAGLATAFNGPYIDNMYNQFNGLQASNRAYLDNTTDRFLKTFVSDPTFPACEYSADVVRVPLPGICFPPYTYFEVPSAINGACGSANNTTVATAPTSNLCSVGTASSVTGTGPWNWSCIGSGTGHTDASCSANLLGVPLVNGVCGLANGVALTYPPTANLCSAGTPSAVVGSGPWTWTCNGAGGGASSACSAPLDTSAPLWIDVIAVNNNIFVGGTATYTFIVHAARIWPFFNYIGLSVNNCPAGATCTLSKTILNITPDFNGYITNPSNPMTLTITGAPAGYYNNIKINADVNGGNLEHGDVAVALKVGPPTCTGTGPSGVTTTLTSGVLNVYAYGVTPDVTSVRFPTWGETNGQNDIVWYWGTDMGGGKWGAGINMANHAVGNPEYGNIYVHTYMYSSNYPGGTLCGTSASFIRFPPTTCNPATVGTNQMYGCSYNGTGFNTLVGGAVTGPALSSPVPDSATALPYQDWGGGGPNGLPNNFSVRWKGNFNFNAGTYAFKVGSDDGNRLYIDGNLFIDKWVDRGYAEDTANVTFPVAGQHTITYEYYQAAGGAAYSLSWAFVPPPPGTIAVRYTVDGLAQSTNQAITYSIWGPSAVASASYIVNDTSSHTLRNVGSYTFNYVSGAPAGKAFSSVSPSVTQSLTDGATITYTVNFITPNAAPVSNATISKDGINYADSITVIRGQATPIYLAASSAAGISSDPNGWTHPTFGMSGGTAKCEWNRDLNQGAPVFELPQITAPAGPTNCNISLGNRTFNDNPGTYTYNVLRLTDRAGAVSATTDTVRVTVVTATVDLKMTVWDAGSRTVPYQSAPGVTTVNSNGPVIAFYSAPLGLSWTLGSGLLMCDLSDSRTGSIKSGFNTSGTKNDTDIGPDSFNPVNRTVIYTLTCIDGSFQAITDTVTVSVPPAPVYNNWICKPDGVTALMVWGISPDSYNNFWVRGYDGATTVLSNDSYDGKSQGAAFETGSLEYVTSPGHTYSFTVRTKAAVNNASYSNPLTFVNVKCPAISPPTVSLKVNGSDTSVGSPLAIPRKDSSTMTLSWTVADANTCTATKSASAPGTWTGSKATTTGSSVLSPINVAGSYNYTLSCTGPGGTTTDTVYISVPACNSLTFTSGSVVPATVSPSGAYTVSCNYGVVNQQTVPIVGSGSCGSGTFVGTTANFNCTAGTTSNTFANSCSISAPVLPDYYCATTNAINNLVVLPSAPPAPATVTANNSICEQVTIQWTDGSGGGSITNYQVWRNTTNTFGGTNVSGNLANTVHSYVNTPVAAGTPYYYWVQAVGPGGTTYTPVSSPYFPTAAVSCAPNLVTSDKDIVAINGAGFSTGNCDGTDPLPANTQLNLGDKLKFSINLCNNGSAPAIVTDLSDSLTNLIMPPGGWNAKYDDGTGEVSIDSALITLSESGTDPNKILTFGNLPTIPKPAVITSPAVRRITFEASLSVPTNFSATSARFQNSFSATYNSLMINKFTPLILFYTGKGIPLIIEVP
ncbi:MAG: PA14 domain-containing protein [Candidatus Doudnabacteria bacterium]|jgi:hypothetical protein